MLLIERPASGRSAAAAITIVVVALLCTVAGCSSTGLRSQVDDAELRRFLPERLPPQVELISIATRQNEEGDYHGVDLTLSDGRNVVVGCVDEVSASGNPINGSSMCQADDSLTGIVDRDQLSFRVTFECASDGCLRPPPALLDDFGSEIPTRDQVAAYLTD